MKPLDYADLWDLADLDKRRLGERGAAPSAGNAYGAIVAPNLDPMRRPDVLRAPDPNDPGERHSSLLSGSFGTDRGEVLVPGVTEDGRILPESALEDSFARTGKHLGIYSSPAMADQAAEAMHRYGAEQMESPSYRPTMWTREDTPGVRFPNRAAQLKGNPVQYPTDQSDPFSGTDDDIFASTNQNQLDGAGGRALSSNPIATPDVRAPVAPPGPGGIIPAAWQRQRDEGSYEGAPVDPWATGSGGTFASTGKAPTIGAEEAGSDAAGTVGGLTPATAAAARGWGAPAATTAATDTAATDAAAAGPTASAAGGATAAGASAGAMPWVIPIAQALSNFQQERQARVRAAADIGNRFGQSQGNFPSYGYQAALQNQRINDAMGGNGLTGAGSKIMGPLGLSGLGLAYFLRKNQGNG